MRQDKLTKILLSLIAVAVFAIAVRPAVDPRPVIAQSSLERQLYFEPGVQVLHAPDGSRSVYGKVVVDLRSGDVWGFPTPSGKPYPFNPTNTRPEISHPFLIGRFALEDLDK